MLNYVEKGVNDQICFWSSQYIPWSNKLIKFNTVSNSGKGTNNNFSRVYLLQFSKDQWRPRGTYSKNKNIRWHAYFKGGKNPPIFILTCIVQPSPFKSISSGTVSIELKNNMNKWRISELSCTGVFR